MVMSLYATLVQAFKAGSDDEKVQMLKNMPPNMLMPNGEIHDNLGNSPRVWLSYISRVTGMFAMSDIIDNADILRPLVHSEMDLKTIEILLEADILADEVLISLEQKASSLTDEQVTANFARLLVKYSDQALGTVRKLLQSNDKALRLKATYAFELSQWSNTQKKTQLLIELYELLSVALKDDPNLFLRLTLIFSSLDPRSLIHFVNERISNWKSESKQVEWQEKTVLIESSRNILIAETAINEQLRREFVLISLLNGVLWPGWNSPKVVRTLCGLGLTDFLKTFLACNDTLKSFIGSGIGKLPEIPKNESRLTEVVVREFMNELIESLEKKQFSIISLMHFLIRAVKGIDVDQYVHFMQLAAGMPTALEKLSQVQNYADVSPTKVALYMKDLKGIARTDAALSLINTLNKGGTDTFCLYEIVFEEAMIVISKAMSLKNTRKISPEVIETLENMPISYLLPHVERLVTVSNSFWRVKLVALFMKVVPEEATEYGLVLNALAKLMQMDDEHIQDYIRMNVRFN